MNRPIAGALLLVIVISVGFWHYPLMFRCGLLVLSVSVWWGPDLLRVLRFHKKGIGSLSLDCGTISFEYRITSVQTQEFYHVSVEDRDQEFTLEVNRWPRTEWQLVQELQAKPEGGIIAQLSLEGTTFFVATTLEHEQREGGDIFRVYRGEFCHQLAAYLWSGEFTYSMKHTKPRRKKRFPNLLRPERRPEFVGI